MLCHNGGIDEAHNPCDCEWQEDQLVQIAEDGNEIGDEIDGRESIRRYHNSERLW
jgi:hypothetical protein